MKKETKRLLLSSNDIHQVAAPVIKGQVCVCVCVLYLNMSYLIHNINWLFDHHHHHHHNLHYDNTHCVFAISRSLLCSLRAFSYSSISRYALPRQLCRLATISCLLCKSSSVHPSTFFSTFLANFRLL